jgi:hypothetical protein
VTARRSARRRRVLGDHHAWTPASPTTAGDLSPQHWHRSDGRLWQDAGSTPAASDGDVVGRWEDKTNNADHINVATTSKKPTLQNADTDTLNGYPVIRVDGIDDFLQGPFTSGGTLAQPLTYFVVTKLAPASVNNSLNNEIVCGSGGDYTILGKYGGASPDGWFINAGSRVDGNPADSDWHIWDATFNGASSKLWKDGALELAGNPGAKGLDGLTFAAYSSGAHYWNGDTTELLFYPGALSTPDLNQVAAYLAARYGLSWIPIT